MAARDAVKCVPMITRNHCPNSAKCAAATVMMHRGRSTWLRTWAAQVARRRGAKRAMVALARRIGVILHRMWVDDTDFRSDIAVLRAA